MKTRLIALSFLAGVLAVGLPLFAHHGNAAYEGTVTVPISDAFDLVGNYGYGKSGRFDSISPLGNDSTDFVNYWQRHWYAGVRVKQLFGHGDRGGRNSYYYDTRPLAGASPVIPPLGETH